MTDNVTYRMPPAAAPTNHGNTSAAWVLVVLVLGGLVLAAIGFSALHDGLTIAGVVVMVVGSVAALALRHLGKGQPVASAPARDWYDS